MAIKFRGNGWRGEGWLCRKRLLGRGAVRIAADMIEISTRLQLNQCEDQFLGGLVPGVPWLATTTTTEEKIQFDNDSDGISLDSDSDGIKGEAWRRWNPKDKLG